MSQGNSALSPWVLFQRPQVNLARPTTKRMWLVSICGGITVLQSSLTDGFASMTLAVTAVLTAVVIEWIINLVSKTNTIRDGSAVASALVFTLLLPNHINPLYAIMGILFAMVVIKHSFGGLGSNWVNPALGGWLFVRFSWPAAFAQALENSPLALLTESLQQGTAYFQGLPLEILRAGSSLTGEVQGGAAGAGMTSLLRGISPENITAFMNGTVFSVTGAELPGGYIRLFMSGTPGIIADRGLLALLLGTILLTAYQVSRPWAAAVFFSVYTVLVRIFGALPFGGGLGNGDVLFAVLTGGVVPAIFLLASDPVTGPKSRIGSVLFACLAGLFTFLFRYPGMEPYGAFFAVALLNLMAPPVREFERRRLYCPGINSRQAQGKRGAP